MSRFSAGPFSAVHYGESRRIAAVSARGDVLQASIPLAEVDVYQDIPVLDRAGRTIAVVDEAWCRGPAHVATWLVLRGGRAGPDRRVVAAERIVAGTVDHLISDLTRADWPRLAPLVSDEVLEAQVDDVLRYDSGLDEFGRRALSRTAEQQHVALRGYVTTGKRAMEIIEKVKAIPGVLSVVVDLYRDDDLAVAIQKAIAADTMASAADVEVQVLLGTVDLTGQGPSYEALRAVDRAAASVPGVLAVHNFLTIAA
jgi:osmotically-inducible protein OsmY